MAHTRDEFVQSLRDSGLANVDELCHAADAFQDTDGRSIANQLISDGKITAYQADAILGRRFRDLVIGNYEILDRLGAGGMGTVFKARHRRMKRIVALKVLSADAARSEAFAQRFQREVETIAKLSHPNIVMAYDADEAEVGLFLVMEFVNGRDLGGIVHENGPMSVADAVDCIVQSARGLEYAHSQHIIHRDIKPGNLLRDESGTIKVADLGLARLNEGGGPGDANLNTSLTAAGSILGTMDYMPPEQALDSASIDRRADVYSLGCTLYYLLVGRPPFSASSMMGLLLKHREAPIPNIRNDRADVPTELDAVFLKMVAKSPNDRFNDMAEVIQALDALKSRGLPTERPTGVTPTAPDVDSSGPTMTFGSSEEIAAAETKTTEGFVAVLVEASRTQAAIVKKLLTVSGAVDVHIVSSGKEALEVAKRVGAVVIISSMHLTDMSGTQLAEAVRADKGWSIGFVLTTSASEGGSEVLPPSSHSVRLAKPFTAPQLAEAIARARS